jgi:hypothetical protein
MQACGERAEIGGDLGRELEADIDSNASAPSATNSSSMATVVGSPLWATTSA